jgi:catalase
MLFFKKKRPLNLKGQSMKKKNKNLTAKKGQGGEIHQTTTQRANTLTSQQGMPISDDQNTLRVGARGPALLEDMHFRGKLFHFDHERIPERVVHARGFGVHGFFENYASLANLTSADLFQRPKERTPAFVRFSTVVGNKGSFDLARDVRGFAVKLYTREGNWDLVGNNMPVFFIQDAMKFPDLVHAAKQEPDRGFPQAATAHDNFWDFISLMPESMHMIMWAMSDRAIPRSFRFMEGFGVHTFRFVTAANKVKFVKFHWKPKLGMQAVLWNEAVKINGADPDFHRRDLWNAIVAGNFPEWELGVQVFDEKFIKKFPFDVLDATKLIPEEDIPIKRIGRLVLNRVVDNFFAETEQVAFCTQNIVPGIDFTNDPLLQGRNFSYLDTQLKRLGSPNFSHLPINAPKCPFRNFEQDGHMAFYNPKGRINFEPNSSEFAGPRENPSLGFTSYPETLSAVKKRARSESFSDHYSQARQFYLSQTVLEQKHISDALIFELSKVNALPIRERMVAHLLTIDKTLGKKVAEGLGFKHLPLPQKSARPVITTLKKSKALSIMLNGPKSFEGRKMGVLLFDGAESALLKLLIRQLKIIHADIAVISPAVGGVRLSDGQMLAADFQLAGGPSVLFDAVVILGSKPGIEKYEHTLAFKSFVQDAYHHLKFIGFADAISATLKNLITFDAGLARLTKKTLKTFITQCGELRFWERQTQL